MRDIIDLLESSEKLEQADLPYSRTALSPVLSKTNIDNHYGKLYKGYVDRYNKKEGDRTFNEAGADLHRILVHTVQSTQKCQQSQRC
jgi:superoxide dismutase